MNPVLIIVILVLITAVTLFENYMKNDSLRKLRVYLQKKDLKSFDQKMDSFSVKYFIHPKYRQILAVDRDIVAEDDEAIERDIRVFEEHPIREDEMKSIYSRVFYYYLSKEDKRRIGKYYTFLRDCKDPQIKKSVDVMYDTYILKKATYLDEMLKALETANPAEKAAIESLIARMYRNLHDANNEARYQKMAEQYIKEL